MRKDAAAEGLPIKAVVADIRKYKSRNRFDIILVDRTLHMLAPDERGAVLQELVGLSKCGTYVLIADERSNIPAFRAALKASKWKWTATLVRRGFLFVQRD